MEQMVEQMVEQAVPTVEQKETAALQGFVVQVLAGVEQQEDKFAS